MLSMIGFEIKFVCLVVWLGTCFMWFDSKMIEEYSLMYCKKNNIGHGVYCGIKLDEIKLNRISNFFYRALECI